jgi:hypothetical protein
LGHCPQIQSCAYFRKLTYLSAVKISGIMKMKVLSIAFFISLITNAQQPSKKDMQKLVDGSF